MLVTINTVLQTEKGMLMLSAYTQYSSVGKKWLVPFDRVLMACYLSPCHMKFQLPISTRKPSVKVIGFFFL